MGRKKSEKEKPISEKKVKTVSELENLIKKNKTFMICSIKSLPGKQYQAIKKKLREYAKVKVVKKNLILKAIDNSGIEIKKMKEHIKEDCALLFSPLDAFELAAILSQNKTPIGAKIGQVANEDIIVEAGPTELVPGPVISELGVLGLKIAIEEGKINIKEKKVIVKAKEVINGAAASIIWKLDIKPFSVGFEPITAYDSEEKKVYMGVKIDKEKILAELKTASCRSVGIAVKIAYICKETLGLILGKASSHENALSKLIKTEKFGG